MTTPNNTGGPAFPCSDILERDSKGSFQGVEISSAGMSLRDYFAAKAMLGIHERVDSGGFARVAKLAYELADAMLEARNKSLSAALASAKKVQP